MIDVGCHMPILLWRSFVNVSIVLQTYLTVKGKRKIETFNSCSRHMLVKKKTPETSKLP